MKYMLDTNICIYAIKKDPGAVVDKLNKCRCKGVCISTLTLAELQLGVEKSARPEKNADALAQLIAILTVLPFDDKAATEYGKICAYLQKRGTPIGTIDTLIAAHAKSEGMTLVTNNVREFERVPELNIENWAQ